MLSKMDEMACDEEAPFRVSSSFRLGRAETLGYDRQKLGKGALGSRGLLGLELSKNKP